MNKIHFKEIDSTNTYAKNNYKDLKNFTFVSADYQSQGHGRFNRKWDSKINDNLMFTLLIKDKDIVNKYASLSIVSAVAVSKVLEKLHISNVSIKWPNDVLIDNKKIAGILLESIALECLVIGIGFNVNQDKFDDSINTNPTSIYLETNKKYKIKKIKRLVYRELLKEIKNVDNLKYLDYANNHNFLYNKEAYATINNEKKLVKILNINLDNTLKVLSDNKEVNLFTDEISFHKN